MPLTLPNLDDRTYADLVEEARTLIPTYAPQWTNHNPSDPGITLIELFAYLTEMLIYRLDRVTDDNVRAFLKLLNGPGWEPSGSGEAALKLDMRTTMLALRQRERAVSSADFEGLAKAAVPQEVARARCVSRRNLASGHANSHQIDKPDHVSIIIVPRSIESMPQPTTELLQKVQDYLEPRRLLTTQVHVVGPRYVTIGVRLTLVLQRDAVAEMVRAQTNAALRGFFHPLTGGFEKQGWPFGRPVYVSEIYQLLDTQPGVDYVEQSQEDTVKLDELIADPARLERTDIEKALIAITIEADELVAIQINDNDIIIKSPLQT